MRQKQFNNSLSIIKISKGLCLLKNLFKMRQFNGKQQTIKHLQKYTYHVQKSKNKQKNEKKVKRKLSANYLKNIKGLNAMYHNHNKQKYKIYKKIIQQLVDNYKIKMFFLYQSLQENSSSQMYIEKLKKKSAIQFRRLYSQQKQSSKQNIENYIKILNFDLKFNQVKFYANQRQIQYFFNTLKNQKSKNLNLSINRQNISFSNFDNFDFSKTLKRKQLKSKKERKNLENQVFKYIDYLEKQNHHFQNQIQGLKSLFNQFLQMNINIKTKYCPDCIQFYQENNFLCSFYELQDDGSYKGELNLYQFDYNQQINEKFSLQHTGIFDFQLISENKILSANVDKTISFINIDKDNLKIEKDLKLDQKPLYIDYDQDQFYISQENGYISIIQNENIHQDKIHSDNVWCIKKHKEKNVLLSGSDDGYLKIYDLNQQMVTQKLKCYDEFPIGVTYIQIDNRNQNNLILGTFSDEIKIYDIRNLKQQLSSHKFEIEGGAWRIKQQGDIFAFGMSFGQYYEIGSYQDNYNYSKIHQNKTTHNSLVYSIDFRVQANILDVLSVSFYDKIINFEKIKLNQLQLIS